MHPRIQLALLGISTNLWLVLSLPSTTITRNLSAGLHPRFLFPSLHIHPGLRHCRCRIQLLPLLDFIWLVIVEYTNPSRSLCKAAPPMRESMAPLNLISLAKFISVHSTPVVKVTAELLFHSENSLVKKCPKSAEKKRSEIVLALYLQAYHHVPFLLLSQQWIKA